MREWADYSVEEGQGRSRMVLNGPLLVSSIGPLDSKLREFDGEVSQIDLGETDEIDTVGAWTVLRFAREKDAEITGQSEKAQRLLRAVEEAENSADIEPPRHRLALRVPERMGELVVEFGHGVRDMVSFGGQVILSMLGIVRHPSRFRIKASTNDTESVSTAC